MGVEGSGGECGWGGGRERGHRGEILGFAFFGSFLDSWCVIAVLEVKERIISWPESCFLP